MRAEHSLMSKQTKCCNYWRTSKNLKTKNNNLSVLMVSTYPPNRDGIASYTRRLEGALRKENIEISLAANGRDWKRNSLSYICSIVRKAIHSKAKIVHTQLSYFTFGNEYYTGLFPILSIFLKLLGKRVVVTLHDIVPTSKITNSFLKYHTSSRFLKFKRWALDYYTRTVCSIADRVIVHTELAKSTLAQDYVVRPKKIHVIPHGIDQAEDDLFEIKSLINKNQRIVSYFGLVRHGKGLEDLVKAWKKVKVESAHLLIIGGKHPMLDDNCYETLVELIRELGLEESILFSGYVLDDRLPVYLRESDVFVFPYNEWGDVIASSGALSIVAPYLKPMIVTDVPAFSYLKTSGAAVVVKKGDINGLASAIMDVLTNAQTRRLLVDNLYKWLPESKWSKVAKKTAELYMELA